MMWIRKVPSELRFRTSLSIVGILWAALTYSASAYGEPLLVELAHDGRTTWTIFLSSEAGPVERFACEELTHYVEKICGVALTTTSRADAPHTIQIGLRSQLKTASETLKSKAGYDGYAASIGPERIVVAGDNPRGVLYGVYDLLERMGCRWVVQGLDPQDPEVVPRKTHLMLPADSWAEAGAIEFRSCNASSLLFEILPDRVLPQIRWAARNRYNVLSWQAHHLPGRVAVEIQQLADCGALDEMTRRGLILHGPGHCFPFFLSSDKYFEKHPEWFGLYDGARRKHGDEVPLMNFCWSNPDAVAEFIRNVESFVARWPQLKMLYMVGIDGGGICQCPNCQARGASDLIVDVFNRLTDRLTTAAPEVIVETVIGYGLLEKPPREARPNGKWRGLYAHWGRNHRQSYGDADYAMKANIETWTKLFPHYTVCSYYAAGSHQPFNSPPFLHAIEGDVKYLVQRGASGHLTLQYPHGFWWNFSFNLAAAGQYSYYYPERRPREQLKDYAMTYFGADAGPIVDEYLAGLGDNENLEASYRASRGDAKLDDLRKLRSFQEIADKAAAAASADPVYSRRILNLAKAMEYLRRLGPARSHVIKAEQAMKKHAAGTVDADEVVRLISAARSYIRELENRADRLEASIPGVMDAAWMRSWTLNRTMNGPLDGVEKQFKAATTQATRPATR